MKAYMIARVKIKDTDTYDRYRAQTPGLVAQYGGRFIARGGRFEQLEGDSRGLDRVVIIEFDSYEQAQTFYRSDEYQAILGLRLAASDSEAIIIEGV